MNMAHNHMGKYYFIENLVSLLWVPVLVAV